MIDAKDIDKIKYSCYPEGSPKEIGGLIGIDTEAFDTGEPFLCMLSNGEEVDLKEIPQVFFNGVPDKVSKKEAEKLVKKSRFLNRHYCTYNLKYDSGALLYWLSKDEKFTLWKYGHAVLLRDKKKFLVEYIPHKYLGFFHRKFFVKVWDVAQYFKMSLDEACLTYIHKKGKIDIETKSFSKEYVSHHLQKIKNYCLKDAQSCAEIGNYLIQKLKEFGIRTTALYSAASLSYEFFSSRCSIITVKRLWDYYKELVSYAIEAYKGGKFECTARGYFPHGYQYDIVSAYPYEIRNLYNIERARVVYGKEYVDEAIYAFLRVKIDNGDTFIHVPCAVKNGQGVDVYPVGCYYTTITKQEYDYLKDCGINVKILSGYWLCIGVRSFSYRRVIDELFEIKKLYKGKDAFLYEVSKKMMNSFYGKSLQLIQEIVSCTGGEKTIYRAGRAFNPVYGSIITANTRIKVTKIQNLLKEHCFAVHTDSVLTDRELPEAFCSGALGEFELQNEGEGVIVACGQYQIQTKGAYKGFKPFEDENWLRMLKHDENRSVFTHETLHVEGWYEAVAKGHYDRINLFQKDRKKIDLNADTKRLWLRKVRAKDLLKGIEQSAPQVVIDKQKPEGW